MKKGKEWLKEELLRELMLFNGNPNMTDYESGIASGIMTSINLTEKLDEPEVLSKELPVIPQFVADYIEKWKYEGLIMHEWFTFDHDDEDEDKVSKWLYNNDDETNKRREFMLIDAIRYSYEIEKEKLYHVVNKGNYFLLRKYDGLVDILHELTAMSRDKYGKDTRFMLTQQEIKDYDERFWVFAEEVTE